MVSKEKRIEIEIKKLISEIPNEFVDKNFLLKFKMLNYYYFKKNKQITLTTKIR